jgi:hypothetical protein
MQAVTDKSVLEAHLAVLAILRDAHGSLSLGTCASPSSSKTHELRVRHEALHTTQSESQSMSSTLAQRLK